MRRTLKFARYLPEFGWDVEVLTVRPAAYDFLDNTWLKYVPEGLFVHRTFCINPKKHLGFRGRYIGILNFLDPFAYWFPFGALAGLKLARQRRFDLIYSTHPGRTAHLIARFLSRRTGIPWVCDFRDPWADGDTKMILSRQLGGPVYLRILAALERRILHDAGRVVANTNPAGRDIQRRLPDLAARKVAVIPNGYDEPDFTGVEPAPRTEPANCVVLLHTGEIYPGQRDPTPLILALESLVKDGLVALGEIRIRFIGAGPALESPPFQHWLSQRLVHDVVSVEPRLNHRQCIAEMLAADVMLLIPSSSAANTQVPAKFYEYLRTGKAILTVAPTDSAAADVVRSCGAGWVVDASDPGVLRQALLRLVTLHRQGALQPRNSMALEYDRRRLTQKLAELFDSCLRDHLEPADPKLMSTDR